MSPTELIIIVFGLLILLQILSNNKEDFSLTKSLGNQVDKLDIDIDYGMDYAPVESDELVNKMQSVLEEEKQVRERGVEDYQNDVVSAMNIPEFYYPAEDIPFDVKRHEYKFEKNPNNVIDEMEEKGEPLELRKIFNNTVKDYKQIEPRIYSDARIDTNDFSYLNAPIAKEVNHTDTLELEPISAGSTSFSKY